MSAWTAAAMVLIGLPGARVTAGIGVGMILLAMIPPFGNLMIELLKGTALVSTITVADLTLQGKFLRDDTHRSFEIFGLLLIIYFLLSSVIAFGFRVLERKLSQGRDYGGGR